MGLGSMAKRWPHFKDVLLNLEIYEKAIILWSIKFAYKINHWINGWEERNFAFDIEIKIEIIYFVCDWPFLSLIIIIHRSSYVMYSSWCFSLFKTHVRAYHFDAVLLFLHFSFITILMFFCLYVWFLSPATFSFWWASAYFSFLSFFYFNGFVDDVVFVVVKNREFFSFYPVCYIFQKSCVFYGEL